jgi:alkyl hydroperoxide reductase subunit AhpF
MTDQVAETFDVVVVGGGPAPPRRAIWRAQAARFSCLTAPGASSPAAGRSPRA